MKVLRFLPILSFLAVVQPIAAQHKMLSMEEAVLKQKTSLAPDKLTFYWIPGGKSFTYVIKSLPDRLYHCSGPTAKPVVLLTLSQLNSGIKAKGADTLKTFPALQWTDANSFRFGLGNKTFLYSPKDGQMKVQTSSETETEEHKDASPDGRFTAFTIDNNLYIHTGNERIQVTKDIEKNIVNGQSVHRDEFGISKGTFWSPASNLLAFYRMDQTMVTDYPVLDLSARPARADMIKYPMAGDKSHEVTVGVYDPKKRNLIFLKTGEPKDQYLTNIAWSPDEKHIYIAVLNRDQNHLQLNAYNASSGEFESTLFEEKDEHYVQPLHPMRFVKNHPDKFIWQSKRHGFNNLYLYDTSGKLIRQLSGKDQTDYEVTELIGFDGAGTHVIYQVVPQKNLIGRIIRSVPLADGPAKTISGTTGTHKAVLSEDGSFLADTWSSLDKPRVCELRNVDGKLMQTLLDAPDPLKEFALGNMRVFELKASDGSPMFCRMILPLNFDSTKKYPVIDYLYGGPGVQLITDSWIGNSDLWYQYMAEHGFVVFSLDNRGSSGRGLAFEQATFRHLGKVEMEDQLKGVDYLRSLSWIDKERMGVFGWSFGGFMTTSLMTRHAGTFKAAVAGGPVIDWSYYEIMYTERYMDTPQTNAEGYAENNLLNHAAKLRGKLLIIHGTSDDVVVWQHSLLFLKKCVEAGTQPDYFVYPGHLHNVLGKDRVHLFNKITAYFLQNL
jgi:dipeptidyl-peptidase-4